MNGTGTVMLNNVSKKEKEKDWVISLLCAIQRNKAKGHTKYPVQTNLTSKCRHMRRGGF